MNSNRAIAVALWVSGAMMMATACSSTPDTNGQTDNDAEVIGGESEDGGATGNPDGASPDGASAACTRDDECVASLPATTPEGCAEAYCNGVTKKCAYRAKDLDGDGFRAKSCVSTGAPIEVGDDCNDNAKGTFPGAWDGPKDGNNAASCEGEDNDCNGARDDGKSKDGRVCSCTPGQKRDCSAKADGTPIVFPGNTPQGQCKKGTETCNANGQWDACTGAVAPAVRDCSAVADLNCDGKPDNVLDAVCSCTPGATQACYPFQGTPGAGPCRAGTKRCTASAGGSTWGECAGAQGPVGADNCDPGNDNNCDGRANFPCECLNGSAPVPCSATGTGMCANGTKACSNGRYGACQPSAARALDCNSGADNNCDGIPDNRQWRTYRIDADRDGYCVGGEARVCGNGPAPAGYNVESNQCRGTDCKDNNANATYRCSFTVSSTDQTCAGGPVGGKCEYTTPINCGAGFRISECHTERTGGSNASNWVTSDPTGQEAGTVGWHLGFAWTDTITAHVTCTCSAN